MANSVLARAISLELNFLPQLVGFFVYSKLSADALSDGGGRQNSGPVGIRTGGPPSYAKSWN
jgi:hypothetical protein